MRRDLPHPLPEPLVELIAARLRVIAEPMRIRLLDRLREGEATVQSLATETGASQQNVSELGLDVVMRQVPVEHEARQAVRAATGSTTIPVLVADGEAIVGEDAIIEYLGRRFPEPAEAGSHRAKAARARARDLEEACRQLTAATP